MSRNSICTINAFLTEQYATATHAFAQTRATEHDDDPENTTEYETREGNQKRKYADCSGERAWIRQGDLPLFPMLDPALALLTDKVLLVSPCLAGQIVRETVVRLLPLRPSGIVGKSQCPSPGQVGDIVHHDSASVQFVCTGAIASVTAVAAQAVVQVGVGVERIHLQYRASHSTRHERAVTVAFAVAVLEHSSEEALIVVRDVARVLRIGMIKPVVETSAIAALCFQGDQCQQRKNDD